MYLYRFSLIFRNAKKKFKNYVNIGWTLCNLINTHNWWNNAIHHQGFCPIRVFKLVFHYGKISGFWQGFGFLTLYCVCHYWLLMNCSKWWPMACRWTWFLEWIFESETHATKHHLPNKNTITWLPRWIPWKICEILYELNKIIWYDIWRMIIPKHKTLKNKSHKSW
jgi:hypothetical protein